MTADPIAISELVGKLHKGKISHAEMTAAADALTALSAKLVEMERENSRLTCRQRISIRDQHGKEIGTAYKNHAELLTEETFVDDDGTAWTPPTAWAYRAICLARAECGGELTAAHAKIARLSDELLWLADFADVRSKDESKVFARVNRGALRTIRDRARRALKEDKSRG